MRIELIDACPVAYCRQAYWLEHLERAFGGAAVRVPPGDAPLDYYLRMGTAVGVRIEGKLVVCPPVEELGLVEGGCLLAPGVERVESGEKVFDVVHFGNRVFEGFDVHVFGEIEEPNVVREGLYVHRPLPYTEHFEVLKRAKMVIVDSEEDEWFVAAVGCGCLPVVGPERVGGLLAGEWEEELEERQASLGEHTWEKRAEALLQCV